VAERGDIPEPAVPGAGQKVRPVDSREHRYVEQVRARAAATGPHGKDFPEFEADGRAWHWECQVLMIEHDARVMDAVWIENLVGARFALIGGCTGRPDVLIPALTGWRQLFGRPTESWRTRRESGYLISEVGGEQRDALLGLGFREITRVSRFRWTPEGVVIASRPVRRLSNDLDYDAVSDLFESVFEFTPSMKMFPGIAEPVGSVTWDLAAVDEDGGEGVSARLEAIVERGLRTCARRDESLYWLNRYHPGYRFDPQRVGGPGQPRWPGMAYPDADYYIHTTGDVRLGTFGHPWEHSLCVFGAELLAQVEAELTALLGRVLRRDGRNQGNTWTFGSVG